MCGDSKAVLSYTLLLSNHPMATGICFSALILIMVHFPSGALVEFWAWTHKATMLIITMALLVVFHLSRFSSKCTICT